MKPIIVGVILGNIAGFIVSLLYLYSLWLPIVALFIALCGATAKIIWKTPYKPSLLTVAFIMAAYFGYFWIPPELKSRSASTPEEHFRAGKAIVRRAQIFGNDERGFNHFKTAAEGDHVAALLRVGKAYLYGHYGHYDKVSARPWLERASDLGSEEAKRELDNDYHYPKNKANQTLHTNGESAAAPSP